MLHRRIIRRSPTLLLSLLGFALPSPAHAAQPRAAVTFLESEDQPAAALKGIRAVLEEQLEQHSIRVVREPAPPLRSATPRQIKRYAKAKHLDRVYDVRLRPRGKRLEVVLTERKPPTMRSTFSARLSAASVDKVQKVIPRLVGAVVARVEPEPEQENEPAAAPQIEAKPQAPAAPAVAPTGDNDRGGGEFLIGASVDLGTLLRSPAGLYGGTVKLFYQWTSLRVGAELGGGGGGGSTFHLAVRSEYLFTRSGFSPYVGAALGYLMLRDAAQADGGGGYFSGAVGLEYSRLRKIRLVAEAEALLPFFSVKRDEISSHNGIVGLDVLTAWSPAILFKLGCLY